MVILIKAAARPPVAAVSRAAGQGYALATAAFGPGTTIGTRSA